MNLFNAGDFVKISCPENSMFKVYNGCICNIIETKHEQTGWWARVEGEDVGWWPFCYLEHFITEEDEAIEPADLNNIL